MAFITGKFSSGFSETIIGTPENDTISPLGGFDLVDGGAGIDTVLVLADRGQFAIRRDAKLTYIDTISSASGGGDQLRLKNVERVNFNDTKLALDLAPNQSAGQAALLIGAVMGRDTLFTNKALMGVGIDLFDQGLSMVTLSGLIMRLPIWQDLAGGSSNTDIARYLLTKVHGVAPTGANLDAAVASINTGAEGDFLAQLALSSANITRLDLVGISNQGLAFS